MDLEVFERCLRRVLEGRDQLAGDGVGCDFTRELHAHPRDGVFHEDIQRDQAPERVRFLHRDIRRADQGIGQQRRLDSMVPTFEASGHDEGPGLLSAICASEHASNPSPAAGFSATPAGSATVVSFTLDCASPVGLRTESWGTCTPTVKPVGVLAA